MAPFQPSPHDWHAVPTTSVVKRVIRLDDPVEEFPNYNFVGRVLGPCGLSLKRVEAATECKVFIRGQGSMKDSIKTPKLSDEKIQRMVKELNDVDEKCQSFGRRRKLHEEIDIDSINDCNKHFNKKIEHAFGKYTLEIKNNLGSGIALPD